MLAEISHYFRLIMNTLERWFGTFGKHTNFRQNLENTVAQFIRCGLRPTRHFRITLSARSYKRAPMTAGQFQVASAKVVANVEQQKILQQLAVRDCCREHGLGGQGLRAISYQDPMARCHGFQPCANEAGLALCCSLGRFLEDVFDFNRLLPLFGRHGF